DATVTGVQTCALPISGFLRRADKLRTRAMFAGRFHQKLRFAANSNQNINAALGNMLPTAAMQLVARQSEFQHLAGYNDTARRRRSEERRVGKEGEWRV